MGSELLIDCSILKWRFLREFVLLIDTCSLVGMLCLMIASVCDSGVMYMDCSGIRFRLCDQD